MGRVSQLEDEDERIPDKPIKINQSQNSIFKVDKAPLIPCPVCEDTFLSDKELQQHIYASHAQYHVYIRVNKRVIRDFDYVEDRIDSIEAISRGPNEVKLQICVNGANVKNTTFSEKISLLPYLKKFTCGEVNISIGSQRFIIYLRPNFNSEVIDRAVFDYLFLPLNERKEPKWDCFNPFISSDRSELERRYASSLYEYAFAFHMMQEKKEAKDHFEDAFGLLSPFTNTFTDTKNFATWARYVLALRMNAFRVLKNCQFPSRFAVANYFFNDSESRFKCNDHFLINRNPVVEYGVYIDDCSETFLDLINEKITEDDFNLIHLIVKNCAEKRGDQPKGKYADYIKPVGNFFSAQDLSKSKILNWLAPLLIFDEKTKELASKASNLERQLHQLRSESIELRTELKKTRYELAEAKAKMQNLEKEVEFKEHSLAEEKERFEMLDEHWKRKCADELAGQAYSFKKYFAHELQEARLSLEGINPDVEMALSRIKHMEDYLAKNGGSV